MVVDVLPRRTRSLARALGRRGRRAPRDDAACCSTTRRPTRGRAAVPQRELRRPCTPGCASCSARGPLLDVAGRLLGEPAVLYKEKINYKLPGGAGYSAAPGRARVPDDRSARVGDDRDRRRRRRQRRARGGVGLLRPRAAHRRARLHRAGRRGVARVDSRWRCRAGRTLWFHSRTPHRSARQPLRPAAAGALPHLQRRAARATAGPSTTRTKRTRFARDADPGDRALVSLIGDFEGRPA